MQREPPRIAVHEAGHALIAVALGRRLIAVRLRPRPSTEAQARVEPPRGRPKTDAERALLEGEIMLCLAGLAAERVLRVADGDSLAASLDDLGRAVELATRLAGRARAEATVAHFTSVVERMLGGQIPGLRDLAYALESEGELVGPGLEALLPRRG